MDDMQTIHVSWHEMAEMWPCVFEYKRYEAMSYSAKR